MNLSTKKNLIKKQKKNKIMENLKMYLVLQMNKID